VFKLPSDNKTDYIKRIVGLPGETVQVRDGRLYINGEQVQRRRIEDFVYTDEYGRLARMAQFVERLPNGREHKILEMTDQGPLDNTPEFKLGKGQYFAMGDNRDNSLDSRVPSDGLNRGVGFVPAENLVGRAEILFFSTNGEARLWEFWRWPSAIRFGRLFQTLA
jgi:signal peptidase I